MQLDLSHFISLTGGKLLRIPLAILSASLLARAVGPEGAAPRHRRVWLVRRGSGRLYC